MTYVVHPVKVISVWSTVKDISGSLFTNLTLYQLYKKLFNENITFFSVIILTNKKTMRMLQNEQCSDISYLTVLSI